MCRTDSDVGGLALRSAPDLSLGDGSEVTLYCPECAARLRLVGPNPQAKVQAKVERSTLPDWLPDVGTVATPSSVEVKAEPMESVAESAKDSSSPSEIGLELTVSMADASEEDEPTRVMNSAELLESEQRIHLAEHAEEPVDKPALLAGTATTSSVEVVVKSAHEFADKTEPSSRRLRSDAPITRDLTSEDEAAPDFKKQSRFGVAGLALGVAMIGGIAFLWNRELQSDRLEVPRAPTVAAASPALAATVATQAAPIANVPSEPFVAPTASIETTVQPATASKSARQSLVKSTADTPRVEPEPQALQDAAKDASFDADAAASALEGAATRASSCRKASDPSGVAVVTVSFAPSGRVTTATISGPPFVGTETGSCIAATLRSARIPAFAGALKTVRKTVTIQ